MRVAQGSNADGHGRALRCMSLLDCPCCEPLVIANIARSPSCSCTIHRSGRSRGSLELPRVLESEKTRSISAPEPADGGQIPTSPSEQHTARNHVHTHEMSAGRAVGAALKDSRGQWSDGNWLIAIFFDVVAFVNPGTFFCVRWK
jgi:hypothetical protein